MARSWAALLDAPCSETILSYAPVRLATFWRCRSIMDDSDFMRASLPSVVFDQSPRTAAEALKPVSRTRMARLRSARLAFPDVVSIDISLDSLFSSATVFTYPFIPSCTLSIHAIQPTKNTANAVRFAHFGSVMAAMPASASVAVISPATTSAETYLVSLSTSSSPFQRYSCLF